MKILRRLLLLGLLVTASPFTAEAQLPELINNDRFRPEAKAAVDSIYNLNYEGADTRLSNWRKKYPEHPVWTLMEGMKFWWKVLSDLESRTYDKRMINLMKKADYRAGKLLHEQPMHSDGLLIKAISNGYLARFHANMGNWLTSVNYGRKAMNAYQYLWDKQPDFNDLKLAEGLKMYYTAYLPEAYPLIKTVSWTLPDGNKKQGLELLREASKESIFASAEARYFLGNIHFSYEKNYKVAVRHFEQLHAKYPNNNYYAQVLVKSYYKHQQWQKALEFIPKTLNRWREEKLPNLKVLEEELLTWKGRILQQQGDTAQALTSYRRAFESSASFPNKEQRSFYVISGYLAGSLLFEEQRMAEARSYLRKVSRAQTESEYRQLASKLLSQIKK